VSRHACVPQLLSCTMHAALYLEFGGGFKKLNIFSYG
jgi:hypothetical protein